MIVDNNVLVQHDFLPDSFIDQVVKRGLNSQETEATLFGGKINKEMRDTRITWLDDTWIYDWILPYVYEQNEKWDWNFSLNYAEDIQFTKYKENQFYNWHQDIEHKSDSSANDQRKISVVIPLSNSDEYEGGDLEFCDPLASPMKKENIIKDDSFRNKGNIIIFPSFVYHRVTKVTKGQRLSMVIWIRGEKWK